MRGLVAWLPALLSLLTAGCLYGDVVRVVDGVELPGRFVSAAAYAAYARGAELEARGQMDAALLAYSEAAARDPDSVEAWTRVGAVRCHLDKQSDATDAFAEAEARDIHYEPLWRARAVCAEKQEDLETAVTHARRAVASDPQRDDTVLLYARLAAQSGETAEAARWLRALSLRSPYSREVWFAVMERARADGDAAWLGHAHARFDSLSERQGHAPRSSGDSAWLHIDAALVVGELAVARKQIRGARLDPRLLPARAIALGRPALAKQDAELRVSADPLDSDARVALALASDLLGEGLRAGEAMAALPDEADRLSDVGRLMLAELLGRHVGRQAALSWLGSEPLVHAVAGDARSELIVRLRARLQLRGRTAAKP